MGRLDGKVALISGGARGQGAAETQLFVREGAAVVFGDVLDDDGKKVEAGIRASGGRATYVHLDVTREADWRAAVATAVQTYGALHVLVNNAGIFADERVITDGVELTFAVNHIGPFLLTELLAPRLEASAANAPSRVINVGSIAHTRGRIHLDDLTLANGWTGYAAYAMSKLANVMHAMTLAERHAPDLLVAYSLHPGVINTKLLRQGFGPIAGGAAEAGAKTQVRLAGEEAVSAPSGSYFSEGVQTQPGPGARDAAMRAALWEASVRLAKL
jgi:NAD(P)-dependent dehydrogenase (short-subunit alcohol dehydrogenase family)